VRFHPDLFLARVKKYFRISAYFGDLKDGTHKGDKNDPRVSIIEVVPEEIRYWMSTQGTVQRGVNVAASAATGKIAVPGELRTISREEVCGPNSDLVAQWNRIDKAGADSIDTWFGFQVTSRSRA
jgi:hypothetical protein